MQFTHKLVAVAASTALLATGATAVAVSTQQPQQVTTAVAAMETPVATDVRVLADNNTHLVSLPHATVADALAAATVTLGEHDRVTPALDVVLAPGAYVTVNRVTVAAETKQVELDYTSTEVKDSSLPAGEKKVKTKGVKGLREDVVETITVDGVAESTRVASQTVLKEPVTEVIAVGTKPKETTPPPKTAAPKPPSGDRSAPPSQDEQGPKPPPSGRQLDLSRAAMWDKIAQCESSGRWNINTGNGYYGGLQFNLPTWRSVNGTDFAAYPHQASREEQITVANRLYAKRGLQPWGCRHVVQ